MKLDKKLIGAGLLSAIAASLCCIMPVLMLIAGTSGLVSMFSYIEPFRPYLIALTIFLLTSAWYQILRKKPDCECPADKKIKFYQTKLFLGIITSLIFMILAFPYYAVLFYPKAEKQVDMVDESNIEIAKLSIIGMTCNGCAEHISYELDKLDGVVRSKVSFDNENAVVEFDRSKITLPEIEAAINSTGYSVK